MLFTSKDLLAGYWWDHADCGIIWLKPFKTNTIQIGLTIYFVYQEYELSEKWMFLVYLIEVIWIKLLSEYKANIILELEFDYTTLTWKKLFLVKEISSF